MCTFGDFMDVWHLPLHRLSARQTLRYCPDGRVRVTATVRDTLQLRWWLLGFGEQVEVIGPETLREEFAETAGEMHRLYGRRGNEFTTDN